MTDEEMKAKGEEIYKGGGHYEVEAALAISIDYMQRMDAIFGQYNPFPASYDMIQENAYSCAMALASHCAEIIECRDRLRDRQSKTPSASASIVE